jgi:uncharacterized protein (TIGR02600 family)
MNTPRHPIQSDRRGVALVLVLAFVSLFAAMLIAFFFSTGSSRREAAQFEAGVTTAQLADSATNIIMGQIADGARSWEVAPAKSTQRGSGLRLTYATQPGLLRTYDADGKPWRAFKLYSSDTMVTAKGSDWVVTQELANEVPKDWPAKPALYTDLNAPVLTPDPNGEITLPGSDQKYTANFPILDPSALSPTNRAPGSSTPQDGVEGFDLVSVPGFGGTESNGRPKIVAGYNPQSIPKPGTTGNPAPMPVQWLYVLQNGTITSPVKVSADGLTADWSNLADGNPNKPGKSNPIVGRIAFWTDDDTSKLNPNVHSEGIAWDRPWARSSNASSPYAEDQLRDRQPARMEYQRYAGHPATVSLSPLFGFIPQYAVPESDNFSLSDYNTRLLPYYNLVPRIGIGGSKGGTSTTYDNTVAIDPIVLDQDRLFATPDELAFTPTRTGTPFVKRRDLEKMKFFLTTGARSPETNLFNQPRLGLWMLQQEKEPNNGKGGGPVRPRNAKDELLAFCSTIGGYPYFFQRHSIYLREQVNNRLSHPTTAAMQVPEFGYVPPSSQRPSLDWEKVARNQDLYKYLQRLTEEPLPGFGGKLIDRYPAAQRDQILTEMVDILRLTNSYAIDKTLPPRYEYAPARQMPDAVSGETQIVPLIPNSAVGAGTKGFGRFPTITEAMLIFYDASLPTDPPRSKMRVLLALEPFTPNAGSWTWSPMVRYVVRGLEKVTIGDQSTLFAPRLVNFVTSRCGYGSGGNHNTAHTGTFAAFRYWGGSGNDKTKLIPASGATPDEEVNYPFVSKDIPIDPTKNSGKFGFGVGGDGLITVEIHSGYATAPTDETLVQTVQLRFPAMSLPLPRDAGADRNFQNRIDKDKYNLVNSADTVRSLEISPTGPSRGDLRIVSALKEVPDTFFAAYPGGADGAGYASDTPIIHSFRNGDGGVVNGGKIQSTLFAGGPRGNYIAARGMDGAKMADGSAGDWDNGPMGFMDGAYINKPDDYYGSVQGDWYDAPTNTPNRQISSGVVFGSLPIGVSPTNPDPWRTLVFSPVPAAGPQHPALRPSFAPGAKRVRDHLFLDFFTMPIVEPYAISEPLSTVAKVNLNYQIAPFSYITRATALHGVLKSTRICAIPTSATSYKSGAGAVVFRKPIDAVETLKGFEERFNDPAKGGMFRSASEICDMYLVPRGATLAQVKGNWWDGYKLTGDNAREAPYGQIYARTTTKSNTFTVHMRVQTLRKRPGSGDDWEVWRENVDTVTGEYRGATTVERYVDLGTGQKEAPSSIPDFATNTDATLDTFYKFRVVQTKKFNP